MRLTGTEDLRVQKTIDGIYSAFEDLICEKDFDKITVKELCDRARVNKKTFYRYYPTINDLLAELQDAYYEDFMERTAGMQIPQDLKEITREFCMFSARQGKAYERITCAPSYRTMSTDMKERILEERPESPDIDGIDGEEERAMLMAFITESTLAIYRKWVAAGKPVSAERMTEMAISLVCGGVDNLMKRAENE
ncbi:TetR/AcrR family transcriptional regulator [Adlercreutzia sp. R21]|uniref:TetR/AcrR family transcriptional regulator n=1 Tax=Adlercreutzia wanghongyangiae TaxID=3111451 RepID=UPI002DBE6EF3|nr:TetR/AcrR family transcriptional regulator [Adlercreutzia sp. R21]MEC4184827.1 TetR/AcrR family transcriptional regulator [Adlercreutzia sp. R21]